MNNLAEHLEKKYVHFLVSQSHDNHMTRYSKGNYSVWYYKSGEIPRTVGYAVDVTVSEYLLEAPGACISSEEIPLINFVIVFLTGVHSPVHCLQHIRAFKSDAEISLMRRAGQIAADSFRKVRKFGNVISRAGIINCLLRISFFANHYLMTLSSDRLHLTKI